jgi:hypothetical protein
MPKTIVNLPKPEMTSTAPIIICADCGHRVMKGYRYKGDMLCETCYIEAQPVWKRITLKLNEKRRQEYGHQEGMLPRVRAVQRAAQARMAGRHK